MCSRIHWGSINFPPIGYNKVESISYYKYRLISILIKIEKFYINNIGEDYRWNFEKQYSLSWKGVSYFVFCISL